MFSIVSDYYRSADRQYGFVLIENDYTVPKFFGDNFFVFPDIMYVYTTTLMFYTLFYLVASACFVFRTTEFVSNGLTVESLFESYVGKEHNDFVLHHAKRTAYTIVVHSCLPLIYLLGTRLININVDTFMSTYFNELFCLASLPVIFAFALLFMWKSNGWANHPLLVTLSRYHAADWSQMAQNISAEYQRLDKLVLSCGTLYRTIVTQNWIISIKPYSVSVAKKSESSFLVYSSDDHQCTPDGNPGTVQFINIQIKPIRSQIKWFFVRIKSEDFRTLEESIGQPIQIASNVKLQRSRTERFIEVFREQVIQNPVYRGHNVAELEDSACAGCLVNSPNVKLAKCCQDSTEENAINCTACQCRPMWCVDCMAKWYESRQSQVDTTNWLSSKCTCPLCRQVFCILDVCPLEHSDLV